MNQVDLFIIVVLGLNLYYSVHRGLLRGVGDVVALFLALGIGSIICPAPAAVLRAVLGLPSLLSDLLGFIISAVSIAVAIGYLFNHVADRRELNRTVDRIGGAVAGLTIGALLVSVLLLFSAGITGTTAPIDHSALAGPLLEVVPALHTTMDRIGLPVTKLVLLPPRYEQELVPMRYGPHFMRLNFARLDGSTCIKCRGPMRFLGYKRVHGSRIAPKFKCEQCGRTTDGCQAFQGMHAIYDQCPVLVARQGVKLNCGIWPNPDWVYPLGRCPVDGNEFEGVTEPRADSEDSDMGLSDLAISGGRPVGAAR